MAEFELRNPHDEDRIIMDIVDAIQSGNMLVASIQQTLEPGGRHTIDMRLVGPMLTQEAQERAIGRNGMGRAPFAFGDRTFTTEDLSMIIEQIYEMEKARRLYTKYIAAFKEGGENFEGGPSREQVFTCSRLAAEVFEKARELHLLVGGPEPDEEKEERPPERLAYSLNLAPDVDSLRELKTYLDLKGEE